MNLALLQDLNLEEESVFSGLGQSATNLTQSSWKWEWESAGSHTRSGTEDIYYDSSLSVLLLTAICAVSICPGPASTKILTFVPYPDVIVCNTEMQLILLDVTCTKL